MATYQPIQTGIKSQAGWGLFPSATSDNLSRALSSSSEGYGGVSQTPTNDIVSQRREQISQNFATKQAQLAEAARQKELDNAMRLKQNEQAIQQQQYGSDLAFKKSEADRLASQWEQQFGTTQAQWEKSFSAEQDQLAKELGLKTRGLDIQESTFQTQTELEREKQAEYAKQFAKEMGFKETDAQRLADQWAKQFDMQQQQFEAQQKQFEAQQKQTDYENKYQTDQAAYQRQQDMNQQQLDERLRREELDAQKRAIATGGGTSGGMAPSSKYADPGRYQYGTSPGGTKYMLDTLTNKYTLV